MRYLRIFAVVIFLISALFAFWANMQYNSNTNRDFPVLHNQYPELTLSVNDPPEALMQGLTAEDATDGDITDRIMVASTSHFLAENTISVKYVVFDSHNNSATTTRRVTYPDYQSPRFSLSKSPVYTRGEPFDLLDHLTVTDDLDGDITNRVRVVTNAVSNYNTGMYPLIVEVSNSCGDTQQLTVWVTYKDKDNTAHIDLRQHILYITLGDDFEPNDWVTAVHDDQNQPLETDNIRIKGNLDLQTPGCYQLLYIYDDGKLEGQADMIVVVREQEGTE